MRKKTTLATCIRMLQRIQLLWSVFVIRAAKRIFAVPPEPRGFSPRDVPIVLDPPLRKKKLCSSPRPVRRADYDSRRFRP